LLGLGLSVSSVLFRLRLPSSPAPQPHPLRATNPLRSDSHHPFAARLVEESGQI